MRDLHPRDQLQSRVGDQPTFKVALVLRILKIGCETLELNQAQHAAYETDPDPARRPQLEIKTSNSFGSKSLETQTANNR